MKTHNKFKKYFFNKYDEICAYVLFRYFLSIF